jgi:hypothetical protein
MSIAASDKAFVKTPMVTLCSFAAQLVAHLGWGAVQVESS